MGISQEKQAFNKAQSKLRDVFNKYSLVVLDRFSSATRASRHLWLDDPQIKAFVISAGYYADQVKKGLNFNVEDAAGMRSATDKHDWLKKVIPQVLDAVKKSEKKPIVSSWYSTDEVEGLVSNTEGILSAIPKSIRQFLEDKSNLSELLKRSEVEDSLQIKSKNYLLLPSFSDLSSEFGVPFVVQLPESSGGKGTYFISNEEELALVKNATTYKVSEFIKGSYSNVTVLTIPDGNGGCSVYVDVPSRKGLGVKEQGIPAGKSAGNEWCTSLPIEHATAIIGAIEKLGAELFNSYGLVGVWGVDLILGEEVLKINEINPRLQGTTEMSSVHQIRRGIPPFYVAHLVHFCGEIVEWMPSQEAFNKQTVVLATSQREAPFYLKLRNITSEDLVMPKDWKGDGVYKIADDQQHISWLRSGVSGADADYAEGEVYLANTPRAGVKCDPDAELGTLEGIAKENLFDERGQLTRSGKTLVAAVKNTIFKR